jgi:hypothetical protein
MEPALTIARHEAIDRDEFLVRDWRVTHPQASGDPGAPGRGCAASHNDWHKIAKLVQRGCPPLLALSIVR